MKNTDECANILGKADQYYTKKIQSDGPTSRGVDWNSPESQELRFEQLFKVCDIGAHFSINDYGCGYGSLYHYMMNSGLDFEYLGIDVSEEMIKKAVELLAPEVDGVEFMVGDKAQRSADYAIASGIFNVKLESRNKSLTPCAPEAFLSTASRATQTESL
ncbi:MAG: methyltransferase domain-containing protein [Thermodesulfobacteriota bacterium]